MIIISAMGLVWSWLATVDEKKKISRQIDKEILQVTNRGLSFASFLGYDWKFCFLVSWFLSELLFMSPGFWMELLFQELKQEADEIDLLLLGAAESGKYFLCSSTSSSQPHDHQHHLIFFTIITSSLTLNVILHPFIHRCLHPLSTGLGLFHCLYRQVDNPEADAYNPQGRLWLGRKDHVQTDRLRQHNPQVSSGSPTHFKKKWSIHLV